MRIEIPDFSVVTLVGVSGSGKSSFAKKHFRPTEILSSDYYRGLVSDDEGDQRATKDAFAALFYVAGLRLGQRRLCVLDATHTTRETRHSALALGRAHHALGVAIVFDLPPALCIERNRARPDRNFGARVVTKQASELRRGLRGMQREGFHRVYVLRGPEEVEAAELVRVPLWTDRRGETGPFDIVGDVHGCANELRALLAALGYALHEQDGPPRYRVSHPDGRRLVFLGDLVDRGPDVAGTLEIAMDLVEHGDALCILGNHEAKLLRKLNGRDVQIRHGLQASLDSLAQRDDAFGARVRSFLDGLVSHYVLDGGQLVVAHAGLKEELQGRASGVVRSFALYGDTSGEIDEFGLPVRHDWAREYRGDAMVVYGHTPAPEPEWVNRTICIDTGCVFGGRLTALRYPEQELVSVPAEAVHCEPVRPLETTPSRPAQQEHDALLELIDVSGKRIIPTRLRPNITIPAENAAAALELASRFTVDPRLLVYLPPTMAPCETSELKDHLEHPTEAFAHYRRQRLRHVICEEKHMGSRAVVLATRDDGVLDRRFGWPGESAGVCLSRTGRAFFDDADLVRALLERTRAAISAAGLWDELATDWLLLDAELMPWSAKAQALLREQYAPSGVAATAALEAALAAATSLRARGLEAEELISRLRSESDAVAAYVAAYRRYCWPVHGLAELRLAPFHLLASERAVHVDQDHVWHMQTLARLAAADPELFVATPYRVVDLEEEHEERAATDWWHELTGSGGEGMVVKPLRFAIQGKRGLVQPALKCRGREYLRIIYGPDYLRPEHLVRLRQRSLARKRSLALREFALGIEGLERFVRREPLRRVHECVFGVLALETEPVDPRL